MHQLEGEARVTEWVGIISGLAVGAFVCGLLSVALYPWRAAFQESFRSYLRDAVIVYGGATAFFAAVALICWQVSR